MSYRIVADSCCDRTKDTEKIKNLTFVPLTLEIGDNYKIFDDENFNQDDFISRAKMANVIAKTACPSPDAWAKAYDCDEDEIFVITITDKLSGTYNSALQGKMIYDEEHPNHNKKIHIFNSLATSGIESLAVEKMAELKENGASFEEVVSKVEYYLKDSSTLYFCLESLDTLKKNGRLFALAAGLLEKLRVKLICQKNGEGNIKLCCQELAMNRAMVKIAALVNKDTKNLNVSNNKLIISHVCCYDRAKMLADKIKSLGKFNDVEIVKCSGLNSTYASNGGIIVSYFK